MTQYPVTCKDCGCQMTVNLTGSTRDREWALSHRSWYCETCTDKWKKEQRAKEAEKTAALEASTALPELIGSEKQIAWARKERRVMLELYRHPALIELVKKETKASWFIEHRQKPEYRIMRDLHITESIDVGIEASKIVKTAGDRMIAGENIPESEIVAMVPACSKDSMDDIYNEIQILLKRFGFKLTQDGKQPFIKSDGPRYWTKEK